MAPKRKRVEPAGGTSHEAESAAGRSKTLVFDSSLVKQEDIDALVKQGVLDATRARVPERTAYTPNSRANEVVICRDLLTASLRFPLDPVVVGILRVWQLYLHHSSPNAIMRLALYMWVCKTSRATPCVEGFTYAHRIHK